jgi:hypothetical protein
MITVILLVSRDFLLDKLFTRLNEMSKPVETNILCLVDGDLNLYLKTRKLVDSSNFREKLTVRAENRKTPSNSQVYRRKRIAELHNQAKQYIQAGEYVLLLEDDGIPPKNAITKLYENKSDVGFISGIELGRWITRYLGAWHMTPVDEVTRIESVTYEPNKIIEVTAAGLYCMLIKKELYEQHEFKTGSNYGPDLDMGLELTRKGYKNYIDTSIIVDHHSESGRVFHRYKDLTATFSDGDIFQCDYLEIVGDVA